MEALPQQRHHRRPAHNVLCGPHPATPHCSTQAPATTARTALRALHQPLRLRRAVLAAMLCCAVLALGHMGFLPWRDRYYSMLLDQLAMGEAVKGVKAAERERTAKAAAAGHQAAAAGLPGSLMVSCGGALFLALTPAQGFAMHVDRGESVCAHQSVLCAVKRLYLCLRPANAGQPVEALPGRLQQQHHHIPSGVCRARSS